MPIFRRGAVIAVPFPYVELQVRERRPALIVSDGGVGDNEQLYWALMITSAQNNPWPGDVAIPSNVLLTGLRADSVVRTRKIATIDAGSARQIGVVPEHVLAAVDAELRMVLGV